MDVLIFTLFVCQKSAPPESEKSPKLRFQTLFGLRGALLWDFGAHRNWKRRDTLSDSFGVPGPKGAGEPCARPGGSKKTFWEKRFRGNGKASSDGSVLSTWECGRVAQGVAE